MNNRKTNFFLLAGDPQIYNVLRECEIVRVARDQSGRLGWLIVVKPAMPLLHFQGNAPTEIRGETTHLFVFGGDPQHVPVLSDKAPTKVNVYAVTSNSILHDGVVGPDNSVLYPQSLIHNSRDAALKYLNPMNEQQIRDWAKGRGLK